MGQPKLSAHDHEIVNVVITTTAAMEMNCDRIVRYTPNAEYDPKRFAALKHRMRLKGCAPTFLIFPTGKIVCAGAKSIDISKLALKRFLDHLRFNGEYLDASPEEVIQNIVAHVNVGHRIHLNRLADEHWKNVSYEPESFPGCTYRIKIPSRTKHMVLLLFYSGKVVITGATDPTHIQEAQEKMNEFIHDYKIN